MIFSLKLVSNLSLSTHESRKLSRATTAMRDAKKGRHRNDSRHANLSLLIIALILSNFALASKFLLA